ncbi:MAG: hypothetical protein ACE15C_13650 [Phycisphaerae bacterium]
MGLRISIFLLAIAALTADGCRGSRSGGGIGGPAIARPRRRPQ